VSKLGLLDFSRLTAMFFLFYLFLIQNGMTPLTLAAALGRHEIVLHLVLAAADVNQKDMVRKSIFCDQ